jgi:hypothetical protein
MVRIDSCNQSCAARTAAALRPNVGPRIRLEIVLIASLRLAVAGLRPQGDSLKAVNMVAYSIVAGLVAIGIEYSVSFVLGQANLTDAAYTGVFVAVFVGLFSWIFATRNKSG